MHRFMVMRRFCMRKAVLGLFASALLLNSPATLAGTTAEIVAQADTSLSHVTKRGKYGSRDLLKVYADLSKVLFRFDLSGIPDNAVVTSVEMSITAATLSSDPPNVAMRFFSVQDLQTEFDEAGADFVEAEAGRVWRAEGMQRGVDFGKEPPSVLRIQSPGRYTFTLDPGLVNNTLALGKRSMNLVLTGTPDGPLYTMEVRSRETPVESDRPVLKVTYSETVPIARAGEDVTAAAAGAVQLDSSASTMRDGNRDGLAFEWIVEEAPASSRWSSGESVGSSAAIAFDADVPGFYRLATRVTNAATGDSATDSLNVNIIPLVSGQHPRLHVNAELLDALRASRERNDATWVRFNTFVRSKQTYTNFPFGRTMAYMLAHIVTGDRQFFDVAWDNLRKNIYTNGQDNSGGIKRIDEIWKDPHSAGYVGGPFIAEVALFYDWGYDTLTADQRQDLINWLNIAVKYNSTVNSYRASYFRNDGAAIVHGIAAAAYATYGDNPEAPTHLAAFREAWTGVKKALDIMGRGGALAEGNSYGTAPTALNLILTCNLIYYATGEDLFASHPFFRQRLAYDAFASYPDTPGGPGSPIGFGFPGVRFVEQSAIGGDGVRAYSWHSLNLRPNGLILARRFARTEEADIWNWVFRQPQIDATRDPNDSFMDLLFAAPHPELRMPTRLTHFDPSLGYLYIRSAWDSPDATWISFHAGPHLDTHQHLDKGSFTIFKRRTLAPKTGHYDSGSISSRHQLGWYYRTVSSNGLLIGDPQELYSGFISGIGCDDKGRGYKLAIPEASSVCVPNDGGQRTMYPMALALSNLELYDRYRDIYETAQVTSFREQDGIVTLVADITNAYNNPRYSTLGNRPKVNRAYRRLVYLREPDLLLIGDTVESTDPAFEKKWLIHALERIQVEGEATSLSPGEIEHKRTDEATIIVDDTDPSDAKQITYDMRRGYAALKLKTIFPTEFRYVRVGGRTASDEPHPRSNNQHFHTHIKDFWVKDYNEGVYPDHLSMNWAPEFPMETQTAVYTPIYGPGHGRWRLEVIPTNPATQDFFLHVLQPTVDPSATMPPTERVESDLHFGVVVNANGKKYRVLFPKTALDAPVVEIE